jgi:DNA (cytosine-5)-methyltransferase 1
MTDRPVAISLFSGAGGLDLGIEAAGFRVATAVEDDADAALTMEKNFHHLVSPVIRRDILDVPTREILHRAGLRGRQRPDLLIGGPPCTPFSKSGFWLEWKRAGLDPGASLLQAYTRVLAEAKPRAFILENVYALTYNNTATPKCLMPPTTVCPRLGHDCSSWEYRRDADYQNPPSQATRACGSAECLVAAPPPMSLRATPWLTSIARLNPARY